MRVFGNSGHGRFYTSFKTCVVRFHQQTLRYFKRRDFSLPSGHGNSMLFPVISMIREVWVAYIFPSILCAVSL